jgi:hypothetical protein
MDSSRSISEARTTSQGEEESASGGESQVPLKTLFKTTASCLSTSHRWLGGFTLAPSVSDRF